MEKIIGIVAEYNPFHAGHSYLIQECRRILGQDCIVIACMSGDFVQRGEWAIRPKGIRSEEACRGGADLVFELPLPWCLSSANHFARGAVGLLAGLGITHLCFGSETGDLDRLKRAESILSAPGFEEEVRCLLREKPELSYPAARSVAAGEGFPSGANDLLAMEYLKCLHGSTIDPLAVKRLGCAHDSAEDGVFPSASEIRRRIRSGEVEEAHVREEALSLAALSRLRMLQKEAFLMLPDGKDGLGSRIWQAVRDSETLPELFDRAKTRRYTHSRVRRSVLCAALGIREGENAGTPPYARLLATDQKGLSFLAERKKTLQIPVITQPKEVFRLQDRAQHVFALGASAHDFYLLGYPDASGRKCGEDYRIGPAII